MATFSFRSFNSKAQMFSAALLLGLFTGHAAAVDPTLSVNNVIVSEGDSGTKSLNFTVTRSGDTAKAIDVTYRTDVTGAGSGDATAGTDYTSLAATTATIAAGATSLSVPVTVSGDTAIENNETFRLSLLQAIEARANSLASRFFATGSSPVSVTAADFNGDGKPDLVTANSSGNSVSVLISNSADSVAFAAKTDYDMGVGSVPSAVVAADFNADGKLDLAVANSSSNTVSVLNGNGDGTFATKVDYLAGGEPRGLTAANFNADGKPDLAVANTSSNTVSVLLNNGSGGFADKVDYPTGLSPFSVTAADFNADDKLDLAVANQGSDSVSVLDGNGNGTFAAQNDYPTDGGPRSIIAADFSGDGKPDLASANSGTNNVSVLINNGSGGFAGKVDHNVGATPRSITAADFSGDGKPDLAAVNTSGASVSVLINNGSGGFAGRVDYGTDANPRAVTAADLNDDNKPDLIATNGNSHTVTPMLNNGDGSFAARRGYNTDAGPYSVATADFNADGKSDLAVANPGAGTVLGGTTVSVLLNSGSGVFADRVDHTTGTGPYSVIAADFNADGKPDLAVANSSSNTVSVLIGNGSGGFAGKVDYNVGTAPRSVVAADFNADGKPDLAVANSDSDNVSVLIGNGSGGFAAKMDYTAGDSPVSLAAADFSGDSKLDLAVVNQFGNSVSVLINDGFGVFATKTDHGTGGSPLSITAADFSGDGKPDLAVANISDNSVSLLINNGSGGFAGRVDYGTGVGPRSITTADFSGDGKPDLAVANQFGNSVSVLINDGLGEFATRVDYGAGVSPAGLVAADLTGDGKFDLAIANNANSTVSVLPAIADIPVTITDNEGIGTITNDDFPSIGFDGSNATVAESIGTQTYNVTLSGAAPFAVTVGIAVTGTATLTRDFTVSPTSLSFAAGETSKLVTVVVVDDVRDDAAESETVILTLQNPTSAGIGAASSRTVTITDNDAAPSLQFSSASASKSEGAADLNVTANVSLSAQSEKVITMPFSINNSSSTATSGNDYTMGTISPVSIPALSDSVGINFSVVNDVLDEDDESLVFLLDTPTNASLGATTFYIQIITDNDATPTVAFDAATATKSEADGTVMVPVSLSAVSGRAVSVPFSITSTSGSADHSITSVSPLTIPAGATGVNLTYVLIDDALDEDSETLAFTLDSPTNAVLPEAPLLTGSHSVTITDNDATPSVTLSLANSPLAENVGVATVTATLSAASGLPVTVNLSYGGTASGSDYSASASGITIPAGSLSGTVTLTGTNDVIAESSDTITVDISSVTNATESGTQQVVATITDDDSVAGFPTANFEMDALTLDETDGPRTITVRLSAVPTKKITVPMTIKGTAKNKKDYVLSATKLVFEAGQSVQTFTLDPVDDTATEADQTVILSLRDSPKATAAEHPELTVTIVDDETPPVVDLAIVTPSPSSIAEGKSTKITASLRDGKKSEAMITVPYEFLGDASFGTDYKSSLKTRTGNLVFKPGTTKLTITVTAGKDTTAHTDSADENVVLTISSPTVAGTATLGTTTAVVTITQPVSGAPK